MALIGLKYLAAAETTYTDDGALPTFSGGMLLGKGIQADKEAEFSITELYADNELAESSKDFEGGTLTLNTADFGYTSESIFPVQAMLFGHKYIAATDDAPATLRKSADDVPPYLGIAYIKTRQFNNDISYEVTMLYKVQFAPPSETGKTKGKNVEFSTPSFEGTFYSVNCTDSEGNTRAVYEDTYRFDSCADAVDYIKTVFGIT
ncbi:MAG: hypothetical protein LUI05_03075 [Oscillospiraceae bacterium]|nr:hypothetical protein [Oscillospiraceae bacterium]